MSILSKTAPAFSSTQKVLHWTVVALLLLQYTFFEEMGRPFGEMLKTGVSAYPTLVVFHMMIGASILVLALWRLSLRRSHGAPPPPDSEPSWARNIANITQVLLYALLILLPIFGATAWLTASETIGELHELGTGILLLLVVLHVGAVLVHQFIWKTGLLSRMT